MTERGRDAVETTAATFSVGPSSLVWDGNDLVVSIDEIAAPFPQRIKGKVRLRPAALTTRAFSLDAQGRHKWWPIAPFARVEVDLDKPGLSWTGHGYLDMNLGNAPLEQDFKNWDWARADTRDGASVLYDVTRRDGEKLSLGLSFDRAGEATEFEPPPSARLARTVWGVPRQTQADDGEARVVQTLEDTPFYARSVVSSKLRGEQTMAIHESLSLDRFASNWVRCLLPFRMPRRSR